jgi:hypothetical protein
VSHRKKLLVAQRESCGNTDFESVSERIVAIQIFANNPSDSFSEEMSLSVVSARCRVQGDPVGERLIAGQDSKKQLGEVI